MFEPFISLIPLCVGMRAAFLIAKHGNFNDEKRSEKLLGKSLVRGYFAGCAWCFISSFIVTLLMTMFWEGNLHPKFGKDIWVEVLLYTNFYSVTFGLLFYLPCALLGYNLRAHQLAEEKIARDHGT